MARARRTRCRRSNPSASIAWSVATIALLGSVALDAGLQPSASTPAVRSPVLDVPASPADRARLEAQAQRARERLRALAREVDHLASQEKTVLNELRRLQLTRERHALEEAEARAAGAAARAALAATSQRLVTLGASARARAPAVRARLRRLYQLGPLDSPRYWVRADSLVETARVWRLLAALAGRDRALLTQASRERSELERLRAEQDARAVAATRLEQAATTAREASARAVAAHQALVTRLARDRELATRLAEELQTAEARLTAWLASPPAPGGRTASTAPAALPLAPFKGEIEWPLNGRVTRAFGRQTREYGTALPRTGIEISSGAGAAVGAIHDGRVAFADQFTGLGRLVIVDHGRNAFSLYGHLRELTVERGAAVTKGAAIGTVGVTPTGNEALYFELRIDGRPVDPLKWLKSSPGTRSRP